MPIQKQVSLVIEKENPGITEEDIKLYDDGWDYLVYVVGKKAYRFARRELSTRSLSRETAFLKLFSSQTTIRVPQMELHELTDGSPYVTYTFIEGVQFKKDVAKEYTQTKLLEVAKQMGIFLTDLHSFSIPKAKELGYKELDSVKSWSERQIKIKDVVYPHVNKIEQNWITNLFEEFIELITQYPFPKKLTHSDLMPEHIIVESQTHQLAGIIDFADMCIADPAYDFAFLRKYGQNFLDTVYENYNVERDETFEKRRQFYEDCWVVKYLEHSIELNSKKRFLKHKQQLTEYIAKDLSEL